MSVSRQLLLLLTCWFAGPQHLPAACRLTLSCDGACACVARAAAHCAGRDRQLLLTCEVPFGRICRAGLADCAQTKAGKVASSLHSWDCGTGPICHLWKLSLCVQGYQEGGGAPLAGQTHSRLLTRWLWEAVSADTLLRSAHAVATAFIVSTHSTQLDTATGGTHHSHTFPSSSCISDCPSTCTWARCALVGRHMTFSWQLGHTSCGHSTSPSDSQVCGQHGSPASMQNILDTINHSIRHIVGIVQCLQWYQLPPLRFAAQSMNLNSSQGWCRIRIKAHIQQPSHHPKHQQCGCQVRLGS